MKKLVLAIVVVSAAACTGENGANGMNGTNGVNGASGLDGMNGATGSNGANGNDVIISDSAKHGLDISPVPINTTGLTSAQIEAIGQGSYLVNALADCGSCHGEAGTTPGFLAGGKAFSTNTIYARNLTPDATTGMKLSETEFISAMQVGTDYTCGAAGCTASTAHTLKIMPWVDYRWSSTSDLKAIYAYLKAIPPVSNAVTADVGPWGAAPGTVPTTYTDGAIARTLPAETDMSGNPIPDPGFARRGMAIQPLDQVVSLDATTEQAIGRGSYLINSYGRCRGCHSASTATTTWMTGGKIFTTAGVSRAMAANLVGKVNGFLAEGSDYLTFAGIIQTGTHVDDNPAPPLAAPMPWQHFKDLTAEDLAAMYTYLAAVWDGIVATTVTQVTTDPVVQDASFYCATTADCPAGESCDNVDATSNTYHECIGRSCNVDTDCKVCQHCSGTGGTCGPFATLPTGCVKL